MSEERDFCWEIMQGHLHDVVSLYSQNYPDLDFKIKKLDDSRCTAYVTYRSSERVTRCLRIANGEHFPLEPPSIVYVDPKTLQPSSDYYVWPNAIHLFPANHFSSVPEGFICCSLTLEFKRFYRDSDWGYGPGKAHTLEEALCSVLTLAHEI
jgi:hypothetical protein